MKIIHVTSGELKIPVELGGGVEGYIFMLSQAMVKGGHNVTVLDRLYSPTDSKLENVDGVRIARLKAPKINMFGFYPRLALNSFLFSLYVNRYLVHDTFDFIHVHNSVVGLCLSLINPGLRNKLIYTSHGTIRGRRRTGPLSNVDKTAMAIENVLVKRARKTIVLNEFVRDDLLSATKTKKSNLVALPVIIDVDKFRPGMACGEIKARFASKEKFLILFVGRIRADKGVEYLLKAANILINQSGRNDCLFLLVGPTEEFGTNAYVNTEYANKLKQYIAQNSLQNNVILAGALPAEDLRKLFACCDIFVLPSLTEAMPTAILEAMASGKAVIGSSVGGVPEQIRDFDNGILVPPADEKRLAEAIRYLFDHPAERRQMGVRGRIIAEERFSVDRIAETIINIYQDQNGENEYGR